LQKRNRLWLLPVVAVVIALGLASRRPGLPAFVQAYAGDVLWGVLFFVLYAVVWPGKGALALAVWAIGTTELIELGELYQGPWALRLRATRVGGLLLGHAFSWSDVLCVFLGGGLAALVDARLFTSRRPRTGVGG
jgi:hypothetical protein